MHRRNPVRQAIALLPLLLLPACGMFAAKSTGPAAVGDLVTRVGDLHVEAELANNHVQAAMVVLRKLTAQGYQGDPVAAFADLDRAVKESEAQADKLALALPPLKEAAAPFFTQWSQNVDAIAGERLRAASRDNLQRTQARFDAVLQSVEPALESCQQLNRGMRDAVLFLGHDLNTNSLATMRDEAIAMTTQAGQLDRMFKDTLAAAEAYIDTAALPGNPDTPAPGPTQGNAPRTATPR